VLEPARQPERALALARQPRAALLPAPDEAASALLVVFHSD